MSKSWAECLKAISSHTHTQKALYILPFYHPSSKFKPSKRLLKSHRSVFPLLSQTITTAILKFTQSKCFSTKWKKRMYQVSYIGNHAQLFLKKYIHIYYKVPWFYDNTLTFFSLLLSLFSVKTSWKQKFDLCLNWKVGRIFLKQKH